MPTHTYKIGRIRKYMLRASINQQAKLSAIIFSIIMLIGFMVPVLFANSKEQSNKTVFLILVAILTGLLSGLLFYFTVKRPLRAVEQKRTEVLGREPTKDEIVAMYKWYKYGVKPTSKAIQPLLPKYLDYLEMRLNGSYSDTYTTSKRYRYFMLIFSIIWLIEGVAHIIGRHHDLFIGACNLIAGLSFSVVFLRKQTNKPRKFETKLNAKRLAKLTSLRQQLN